MWLRNSALVLLFSSVALISAQDTPPPSPTIWPPFPAGMRIIVGSQGVLVRNAPHYGMCGEPLPGHECTAADAVLAGIYGVIQTDPPVFETSWWWSNVLFDNGIRGWVSAVPPFINQLTPPQMALGFPFRVVGDYNGPNLTNAICINDGINSAAVMNLQAIPGGNGSQGTLSCDWGKPSTGNHIAVIRAVNPAGTAQSTEFQFAVSTIVVQQVPTTPGNLRIAPADLSLPAVQTAKPNPGKK